MDHRLGKLAGRFGLTSRVLRVVRSSRQSLVAPSPTPIAEFGRERRGEGSKQPHTVAYYGRCWPVLAPQMPPIAPPMNGTSSDARGGLLVKYHGGEPQASVDDLRAELERHGLEVGRLEREGRFRFAYEPGEGDRAQAGSHCGPVSTGRKGSTSTRRCASRRRWRISSGTPNWWSRQRSSKKRLRRGP